MKATRRVVKFAAGGLWILLACNAIAGHVTIHDEVVEEDDIDLTVVATNTAYRYHAVAASKWLLDTLDSSTNQAKDRIKDHEFKRFKNGFVSGTFVSARYTWTNDRIGRDGAMIYHAASGQPRPWLPDRMTPVADYERYFPSNHLATHAVIGDAAASGVSHTDIGGTPHGNDAEIKLLRTLEQDLRNQAVGTGGRLHIYVSTKVCDSCEIALQRFAAEHDIDIDVHPLSRDPLSPVRRAVRQRRRQAMDDLECELALRKASAQSTSTLPTSSTPSPGGGADGLGAAGLLLGCSGISIY